MERLNDNYGFYQPKLSLELCYAAICIDFTQHLCFYHSTSKVYLNIVKHNHNLNINNKIHNLMDFLNKQNFVILFVNESS